MELPVLDLDQGPVRHAHCCLSISRALLESLTETITRGDTHSASQCTVLSVGSGTGLLEALLATYSSSPNCPYKPCLVVEGVEVALQGTESLTPNKYLSEKHINTVRTSWELSARIRDPEVTAILFVFPRQPALVSRYVDRIREQSFAVRVIIWLGPIADWDDFAPCFSCRGHEHVEIKSSDDNVGLQPYEMMAIWRRDPWVQESSPGGSST